MIIYRIGLPGSASTWAYNVVRSILEAANVEHLALRGETYGDFTASCLTGAPHAVIKSHRVEAFMAPILSLPAVKVLVTVRDPRDATTSLVQRFGMDASVAAMQVNRSLASILTLANAKPHLVHHFEDRFFAKQETVVELANFIGANITPEQSREIADRFSSDAIKPFLAAIDKLPRPRRTSATFDTDTQLHQTHISDMKIGKWASVLDEQTAITDRLFGSYAEFFARRRSHAGECDVCFNPEFHTDMFRPIDDLDSYERKLDTAEVIGSRGLKVLDHIYLRTGTWTMEFSVETQMPASISVCQNQKIIARAIGTRNVRFAHENRRWAAPIQIHVDINNGDIAPPDALLSARYQPPEPKRRNEVFVAEASGELSFPPSPAPGSFTYDGHAPS
jgi:hypothetical protein